VANLVNIIDLLAKPNIYFSNKEDNHMLKGCNNYANPSMISSSVQLHKRCGTRIIDWLI